MPTDPLRNRRKTLQNRERYDKLHTNSLQAKPTPAMRQRAFVAMLLKLSPAQVSDQLVEQVEMLKPSLLTFLAEKRGRRDGRPPGEYITRYFGIDTPIQTTQQISAELEVAETSIQNAIDRGMETMRGHLETLAPRILVDANELRAVTAKLDFSFWDRVDKSGDCWVWKGATDLGYGVLKRGGKKQQAHRYAYELVNGPVAKGMHIVHACRNRACVNPEHLHAAEPGDEH